MTNMKLPEGEVLRRRLARYSEAIRLVDEGKARPQVVEVVGLLRQGLHGPEIAKRLGLARSTVYQRLSDPTDAENRARKAKQDGTCENCGGRTAYNSGGPSRFCHDCYSKASIFWTQETIIEAIREYHRRYRRQPGAMDWNLNLAHRAAAPERLAEIEKRWDEGLWPTVTTVQERFGSWSAAIYAAGFHPLAPGQRLDPERWARNRMASAGRKGV